MTRLFIIILTAAFCSCNNSDNSKANTTTDPKQVVAKDTFPVKELFVDKGDEEGWGADIRLSITEIVKTDTSITYFANSLYYNKNVGLKIIIPTASPKNEKELAQILTLQSSGNISDNLVQTLSKLYKEKADTTLHFVSSKRIAFIDLNEFAKAQFGQEPANKTTAKEMKIFFEAKNPDDNAELYININEAEHWLEIREKDEGYRKQVIKGLTTK
ncbi:MAG TPA: hypothetical protein VFW07_19315 [Parafilimonas sp.]|nr:hypothetical protein [Parafilimonas sp.]